jgi:hypothetical protein
MVITQWPHEIFGIEKVCFSILFYLPSNCNTQLIAEMTFFSLKLHIVDLNSIPVKSYCSSID